ncbi:hypothetical protein, partial [Burkholderia stagnalis]|uniref:hypothetical protein n=1 Tax=Burkholderia stagnalis TaxID=1503054 RepID=UPI001E47A62B
GPRRAAAVSAPAAALSAPGGGDAPPRLSRAAIYVMISILISCLPGGARYQRAARCFERMELLA